MASTWLLALLIAVTLWWLGLTRLPQGLILWLAALPPTAWLLIAGRALRANTLRRPPRRCADPSPAQILAVERAPGHAHGALRFAPLTHQPDGRWAIPPDAPTTTLRDLPAWTLARYEPGLWVAITYDLDQPSAPPSLYPPPGGGRVTDALADLFIALIRLSGRAPAGDTHPIYWLSPQPPSSQPPPTPHALSAPAEPATQPTGAPPAPPPVAPDPDPRP